MKMEKRERVMKMERMKGMKMRRKREMMPKNLKKNKKIKMAATLSVITIAQSN